MDKLGEALVVLTSKADEKETILCHMIMNTCPAIKLVCSRCIYFNHKLLDKSVILLSKLED